MEEFICGQRYVHRLFLLAIFSFTDRSAEDRRVDRYHQIQTNPAAVVVVSTALVVMLYCWSS